jgi:hypothetical protein
MSGLRSEPSADEEQRSNRERSEAPPTADQRIRRIEQDRGPVLVHPIALEHVAS